MRAIKLVACIFFSFPSHSYRSRWKGKTRSTMEKYKDNFWTGKLPSSVKWDEAKKDYLRVYSMSVWLVHIFSVVQSRVVLCHIILFSVVRSMNRWINIASRHGNVFRWKRSKRNTCNASCHRRNNAVTWELLWYLYDGCSTAEGVIIALFSLYWFYEQFVPKYECKWVRFAAGNCVCVYLYIYLLKYSLDVYVLAGSLYVYFFSHWAMRP